MPLAHLRVSVVERLISARSASEPPSPLLSARMMMVTYLRLTMIIIDQKIRLRTP